MIRGQRARRSASRFLFWLVVLWAVIEAIGWLVHEGGWVRFAAGLVVLAAMIWRIDVSLGEVDRRR